MDLIKTILLSLLLIFLIHTLFEYFKNNFTDKKIYDYVNNPGEKYKNIYDKINSEPSVENKNNEINNEINNENKRDIINNDTTNIDDLDNNINQPKNMKDQLKMFLKDVQKQDVNGYNNTTLNNNEL
jgi:hypothetical protein|tara:strand:- start:1304 stop:1684 length:381 start_codon:yes stop_codon:yes gene_type:complete